jgi:hypothetical protein
MRIFIESDRITTVSGSIAAIAGGLGLAGFFPITMGLIAAIAGTIKSYYTNKNL